MGRLCSVLQAMLLPVLAVAVAVSLCLWLAAHRLGELRERDAEG